MSDRRGIKHVDDRGEVVGEHSRCSHPDECEECGETRAALEELERKARGYLATITRMRNKAEDKAKDHPRYEEAEAVHAHWRIVCKHPKTAFDAQQFEELLPFLAVEDVYGRSMCLRAIDGAAYDPYVTIRRNGSKERHDAWHTIFGSKAKFQGKANKAPRGWTLGVSQEMESWKQGPEGIVMPEDWKPPAPETETGQQGLIAELETEIESHS